MTVKLYDKNDNELIVTGDYQKEEKPVFYYKDGSGDPGCPAEFNIEKIECNGIDVTNGYTKAEIVKFEDDAIQYCIDKENEIDDRNESEID